MSARTKKLKVITRGTAKGKQLKIQFFSFKNRIIVVAVSPQTFLWACNSTTNSMKVLRSASGCPEPRQYERFIFHIQ